MEGGCGKIVHRCLAAPLFDVVPMRNPFAVRSGSASYGAMKEYREGIYKKVGIGPVVTGFLAIILIVLVVALIFFRSGHPNVPMQPPPKNNKGKIVLPAGPRLPV